MTLNSTMVAIGSAVTVDALSSFRGVMFLMSGASLSAAAATCWLCAIAPCVEMYWEVALADVFWFGL